MESFDDLIFEGRNKEYGAYALRKSYERFVITGIILGIIIVSLLVIIPYIQTLNSLHTITAGAAGKYITAEMDKLEQPEEEIYIPQVPAPPPEAQQVVRYVAPVLVDTVLNTELLPLSVDEVNTNTTNTDEVSYVSSGSDDELTGDINGQGGDEPFILVEVPPTFKGGNLDKFREWVQKRVIYPKAAEDNGIQGRVYLTFVVERDGTVTNVNVVRSVDKLLDEAAKKAIEESPNWSPGLQRGRPVRVRFSIFLNFTL
ncbi:MAG: energy transducer TonB [Bacteroidales bacterium]